MSNNVQFYCCIMYHITLHCIALRILIVLPYVQQTPVKYLIKLVYDLLSITKTVLSVDRENWAIKGFLFFSDPLSN